MKYIRFSLIEQKPKTAVYEVLSITQGTHLGMIAWYGPWRQYVFYPGPDTIWSDGCLAEVREFLQELKKARENEPR